MAEGLATEDGTAIDLDVAEQEFARAMAAPEPGEPEAPAPPKRQQLTEEELGEKNGWITNPDGTRRAKRAKGRPSTKPRTTTAPAADGKPGKTSKPAAEGADYTRPLGELTSALWMVAASAPIPGEGLRVKVRAQAHVLRENQGGLVQGVNLMAQHNGTIRRGVEALTMGNAGWVLPAVMALAPFAVQSAAVWRAAPEQLAELAAHTEAQWAEEFAAMQAAFDREAAKVFDQQEAAA